MDLVRGHGAGLAEFDRVIRQVRADQWDLPTPCAQWSVRQLVNHVVNEALWAPPLIGGKTIAEVGDSLDGDLLGEDPIGAWESARDQAERAGEIEDAETRLVDLSFGPTPAAEYLRQLTADYLVHAWDLATAIGVDDRMRADLVGPALEWFRPQAEAWREAGAVGHQVPICDDESAQSHLLGEYGRDAERSRARSAVNRFEAAFARRDLDAVMAAMTEDCVFESTAPPDGRRYVGQAEVRSAWAEFFASTPQFEFVEEERIVARERVISRWRYDWGDGHVRGVDVYRVEGTLVAEKFSYVKG